MNASGAALKLKGWLGRSWLDLSCLYCPTKLPTNKWDHIYIGLGTQNCPTKGGVAMWGASEILALPERGGGRTHAKIFWWIWQSVQRPNLSDNGPIKVINLPPKIITFPQKCDQIPSISDHFPRNHFDPPKYVDLRAFYWLSRVAFTHFLSRNPPVCQDWGVGD